MGASRTGTWWYPPPDKFSAGNVWFFDSVGEKLPYGWRQGYQPAGALPPSQIQFSFTYTTSGSGSIALSFPSGTRQTVTLLGYDESTDVLRVNWEGYEQVWYGCQSGQMAAVALAACR
ncbi:MAG: hypothetical protein HYX32_14085 [Actinobacteria bacterium]|nr:hypothetical protein [Actinomycetota bacterium]